MSSLHGFAKRPPYASALYGVYQPMLGWRARTSASRLLPSARERADETLAALAALAVPPMPQPPSLPSGPDPTEPPLPRGPGRPGPQPLPVDPRVARRVGDRIRAEVAAFVKKQGRPPNATEWPLIMGQVFAPTPLDSTSFQPVEGSAGASLSPCTAGSTRDLFAMATLPIRSEGLPAQPLSTGVRPAFLGECSRVDQTPNALSSSGASGGDRASRLGAQAGVFGAAGVVEALEKWRRGSAQQAHEDLAFEHLPPRKQEELRAITTLVCEAAPVGMLVLFGSHARGDWGGRPRGRLFQRL